MNKNKMDLPDGKAIQDVGQIGSHNTYEHGGDWYGEKNDWRSNLDWVNAVEFDVWPSRDWLVSHGGNSGGHLEAYIQNLADWRKKPENQNHDLVTVCIEIKSSNGWRVPDFESCLLDHGPGKSGHVPALGFGELGEGQGICGPFPARSGKGARVAYFWRSEEEDHVCCERCGSCSVHVFDERPLVSKGHSPGGEIVQWNTNQSSQPTCFVMTSWTDLRRDYESVVVLNDTYNGWPAPSAVAADAQRAFGLSHNCLRRAYDVKDGNAKMVGEPKDLTVATKLMTEKKINYLCYDKTKNAFWTSLA